MGLPQCELHYSEFIAYLTKEDWRKRGVRKGWMEGNEREDEGRRGGEKRREGGEM